MKKLEEVLEKLLAPRELNGDSGVHIELATSLWLTGRWAELELRPHLIHEGASGEEVPMTQAKSTEKVVQEIRRKTRRRFSALLRKSKLAPSAPTRRFVTDRSRTTLVDQARSFD